MNCHLDNFDIRPYPLSGRFPLTCDSLTARPKPLDKLYQPDLSDLPLKLPLLTSRPTFDVNFGPKWLQLGRPDRL